jgi:type I restriction enzyme S subunit
MELGDICEMIVDCEHKTAPIQETGYPSIRTPNIGRGYFILGNVNRVSDETYRKWTRRAVPKVGDLIMAREAPVGNVAIIPDGLQPCLGQRTVLIRCNNLKVIPRYLVYLLVGPIVQATIHSMTNGVTVPHLNVEDIRTLPLPDLPPLPTQRKIASILSAYDDLIENNTRRIQILEKMAQAIYREWFVHFRFPGHEEARMVDSGTELGEVPEGWEVARLMEIAEEIRRSVNPEEVDPETPYLGLEHLPRKSIALDTWGKAEDVNSTKLAFEKNEILFGKIRPYLHKVGVAPISGICSSDTIVIKPKQPKYFSLAVSVISSNEFVAHATQTSQGTKMPRANWDVLVRYHLVIPPDTLLSQFNSIVENIIFLIQNLVFKNRNLRQQRDLLLPKLVSGELDVSELEIPV